MEVVNKSPLENSPLLQEFRKKFTLPLRPAEEIPNIPSHLDELSDADLMEVYTAFMSWLSYAKSELVASEIEEERCANDCRLTEAKTLIKQWGNEKGDTVTLAKARRDVDELVIAAQEAHFYSRAYRKLVDSVFDRCERGAQVLSRELSRRIGLGPKERQYGKYSV